MNFPIYLDNAATTPIDPRVLQAMLPAYQNDFGNPHSNHHFGWQAADLVDKARQQVANLFKVDAEEIIFTSGATEAVNLAFKGYCQYSDSAINYIITNEVEHKATSNTLFYLKHENADVSRYVPLVEGEVDLKVLERALKDVPKALVIVMWVNNETGIEQPIYEIGQLCKKHDAVFFCDATQAVGKMNVRPKKMDIDIMAFSGHKINGPKGVGGLYVRKGLELEPQMLGGGQENGLRSGTLNVPGIVGLGKACELAENHWLTDKIHALKLRHKVLNHFGDQIIENGRGVPHILNFQIKGVNSTDLMNEIAGSVALSRGSACSSDSTKPSYVLKAMGLTDEEALSSIRMSFGRFTSETEVDIVLRRMSEALQKIEQIYYF